MATTTAEIAPTPAVAEHVMIEISGRESKIEAFIEMMRPFGILEMVRTGRVAMLRADSVTVDLTEEDRLGKRVPARP